MRWTYCLGCCEQDFMNIGLSTFFFGSIEIKRGRCTTFTNHWELNAVNVNRGSRWKCGMCSNQFEFENMKLIFRQVIGYTFRSSFLFGPFLRKTRMNKGKFQCARKRCCVFDTECLFGWTDTRHKHMFFTKPAMLSYILSMTHRSNMIYSFRFQIYSLVDWAALNFQFQISFIIIYYSKD